MRDLIEQQLHQHYNHQQQQQQQQQHILIYPFQTQPVQLVFEENVIKLAIKSACSFINNNVNSSNKLSTNNEFNCLFVASPLVDDDNLSLIIDDFDAGRSMTTSSARSSTCASSLQPTNPLAGCIYVPTKLHNNNNNNSDSNNCNHNNNNNMSIFYANAIRLLATYCTSCSSSSIDSLSNFISMYSSIVYKSQLSTISADSCFDMITLSNRFLASKIQPIQILTTALSKTLQSAANFYSTPKTGYCTLKENKEILLVLESDPKANTLPLYGIWISGVKSLNHPLVWSACIRYMFSQSILKRLNEPHEPFVIVHFASTHKRPDFYRCTTNQVQLEFTMFSGQDKLITTKALTNGTAMSNNKITENRAISVDLVEVKEGYKLKLFLNGLNDALRQQHHSSSSSILPSSYVPPTQPPQPQQIQTSFNVPQNSMLNLSLNDYNEQQQQQTRAKSNDLASIKTDSGVGGLYHSVSDISVLSDDDLSDHTQSSYSKLSAKPSTTTSDDSVMTSYSSACSSSSNMINTQSMIFGIPRNPPPLLTNFTSKNEVFKQPLVPHTPSPQPQKTILKKSSLGELHSLSTSSLDTSSSCSTSSRHQMSSNSDQLSHNKLANSFDKSPQQQQQQQSQSHQSLNTHNHSSQAQCFCQEVAPTHMPQSQTQSQTQQLIQTPLGIMTQQELLDLLLQKTAQVQTLQEQVNILMAHHLQQQHFQQTQVQEAKIQCDLAQEQQQQQQWNKEASPIVCETSMQTSWLSNESHNFKQQQQQQPQRQQQQELPLETLQAQFCQTPRLQPSVSQSRLVTSVQPQQQQRINDFNKTLTPEATHQMHHKTPPPINTSWSQEAQVEKCKNTSNGGSSEPMRIASNKALIDTSGVYVQKSMIEVQKYYHNESDDDDEFDESNTTNYDNVFRATLTQMNKFGVALPPDEDISMMDTQYTPRHMMLMSSKNNQQQEQSYYMNMALLPKVQYESICFDEYSDKNLSLEVNGLAMKYLKDDQLTRVAKSLTQKQGKTNLYNQLIHEQDENEMNGGDEDQMENKTFFNTNNISLASKQYLEKYGILKTTSGQRHVNDNFQSSTPHYARSQSQPSDTLASNILSYQSNANNNNNNNTNEKIKDDNDEIWLFGTPPNKASNKLTKSCSFSNGINQIDDKFSNSYNEMQIRELKQQQQQQRQQQQHQQRVPVVAQMIENLPANNNRNHKSHDDLDDVSHILDIENLKKLPKLL